MTRRIRPNTASNKLDDHLRRIRALEALDPPEGGCCPGDWVIPDLLNGWVSYFDTDSMGDCEFAYRWGPFDSTMDVNDAGIEFRGQVTGGTTGTVVFIFPPEDLFECDKDFGLLMIDQVNVPFPAAGHIDSATGELTVYFPI